MNSPRSISLILFVMMTAFLGVVVSSSARAQDPIPTITSGIDTLVVYDANRQPMRRIPTLPTLGQCVALSPESFFLYVFGTGVGRFHDVQGVNTSSFWLKGRAFRIVASDASYIIVLDAGAVVEVDKNGADIASIDAHDAVWADKIPNGGAVVASRSGELRIFDWGTSTPRLSYGQAQANRPVLFQAVAVVNRQQIVAFDSIAKELVWFDFNLHEVSRRPIDLESPTIFEPLKDLPGMILKGSQEKGFRILNADRSITSYKTQLSVSCAGALPGGGFILGYTGGGAAALITPPFDAIESKIARLTYDCLAAVIAYAFVGAIAFGSLWIAVVGRVRKGTSSDDAVEGLSEAPEVVQNEPTKTLSSLMALCFLLIVAGLVGAWAVYPGLSDPLTPMAWLYYGCCSLVSGLALVCLGTQFGIAPRLRPFVYSGSTAKRHNKVYWFLIFVSIALAAACNYLNIRNYLMLQSEMPKVIVFCWIAAQVLIVMAVTRQGAPKRLAGPLSQESRAVLWLCAFTLATRLLWIGEYPHEIHHDFGVMSHHIFRYLLEPWYPFFVLDAGQGIGRPWYMQLAGVFWLFGVHDWSMRLTSAFWAVGFVLASYLIGRETVSHRFGLIFGALVAAQHNMLGYSRCPYVTESTAPFLFCLYYFCRGFRTRFARDFAIAGIWGAWSLLTVRNFTPFPFIGAALFLFFCVFYARTAWALRWHLLLMVVSATIVFGPYLYFYLFEQELTNLLSNMSPLYRNHQFSTDISLWLHQFKMAFGGILVYPDRISWPMETLAPICLAITGALFGAGLVFVVTRFRSVGAATALIAIVVDNTLGSAFLEYPPSYYHVFIVIVFVMYIAAIPLEVLWETATRVQTRSLKNIVSGGLMVLSIGAVVEEASPFIQYSLPKRELYGVPQPNYRAHSLIARYMLKHRDRRFVAASKPGNFYEFHNSSIAITYGEFSERFELLRDLNLYLPLRPGPKNRDTSFFFTDFEDFKKLKVLYPQGMLEGFACADGEQFISVYTVSGEEIQRAWLEESPRKASPYLSAFQLTPS